MTIKKNADIISSSHALPPHARCVTVRARLNSCYRREEDIVGVISKTDRAAMNHRWMACINHPHAQGREEDGDYSKMTPACLISITLRHQNKYISHGHDGSSSTAMQY